MLHTYVPLCERYLYFHLLNQLTNFKTIRMVLKVISLIKIPILLSYLVCCLKTMFLVSKAALDPRDLNSFSYLSINFFQPSLSPSFSSSTHLNKDRDNSSASTIAVVTPRPHQGVVACTE